MTLYNLGGPSMQSQVSSQEGRRGRSDTEGNVPGRDVSKAATSQRQVQEVRKGFLPKLLEGARPWPHLGFGFHNGF